MSLLDPTLCVQLQKLIRTQSDRLERLPKVDLASNTVPHELKKRDLGLPDLLPVRTRFPEMLV